MLHHDNVAAQATNSDVRDSATAIGEDIPSIFIVTNSDNDSHGSAHIQDTFANVLSILNNIQSQNAKANELCWTSGRRTATVDRLTEQLQHEITKETEAICQLREETRHQILRLINELSSSVDERVSRHADSTKEQHDSLRNEMNTELNVA